MTINSVLKYSILTSQFTTQFEVEILLASIVDGQFQMTIILPQLVAYLPVPHYNTSLSWILTQLMRGKLICLGFMSLLYSGAGFCPCSPATNEALFSSTMLTLTGRAADMAQKFLLKLYPKSLSFPFVSPPNRRVNLDFCYTGDITVYLCSADITVVENPYIILKIILCKYSDIFI